MVIYMKILAWSSYDLSRYKEYFPDLDESLYSYIDEFLFNQLLKIENEMREKYKYASLPANSTGAVATKRRNARKRIEVLEDKYNDLERLIIERAESDREFNSVESSYHV